MLSKDYVEPAIESGISLPPADIRADDRRRKPRHLVSPRAVFLRKLKPGQSFKCLYSEWGGYAAQAAKNGIQLERRRLSHNLIRVWCIATAAKPSTTLARFLQPS